jgi:hypothetical protein
LNEKAGLEGKLTQTLHFKKDTSINYDIFAHLASSSRKFTHIMEAPQMKQFNQIVESSLPESEEKK